jgi:hypothetical protein
MIKVHSSEEVKCAVAWTLRKTQRQENETSILRGRNTIPSCSKGLRKETLAKPHDGEPITYKTLWKRLHQCKLDHVQCRHPRTLAGSINAGYHHFSRVRTATAYTPVSWWLTSLHVDEMVMLDQHQSFMAQDWVLFLSNMSGRTLKWFCKKHRQLGIG